MNPQSVSVREIWADEGRELAAATVESKESLLASQSKLSAEVAALKEELFALKGLQVEIGDLISSIASASPVCYSFHQPGHFASVCPNWTAQTNIQSTPERNRFNPTVSGFAI